MAKVLRRGALECVVSFLLLTGFVSADVARPDPLCRTNNDQGKSLFELMLHIMAMISKSHRVQKGKT